MIHKILGLSTFCFKIMHLFQWNSLLQKPDSLYKKVMNFSRTWLIANWLRYVSWFQPFSSNSHIIFAIWKTYPTHSKYLSRVFWKMLFSISKRLLIYDTVLHVAFGSRQSILVFFFTIWHENLVWFGHRFYQKL